MTANTSNEAETAARFILPIADGRTSWAYTRAILRERRGPLLATTVLLLAGSACALLIPPILGRMVDAVIDGSGTATLGRLAGGLVAAGLASALLLRWGGQCLVSTLQGALAQLREQVFEAALNLDSGDVESAGTSDVVSRVTGDVEAITAAVSDVLPRVVNAAFTIGLTALGLALLDPWLALAALAAVPLQVASTRRFLRRSRPLYRRLRREEAERGQAIIESVRGADTVVAHRTQDEHLAHIATRSLTAVETQREAGRVRNRFYAGLNAAEFIGLAAVLVAGYWQSVTAGLSVGAVTAAALFFHRLFDPIGSLLGSIDDLQRGGAGLSRLVGVLLARPSEPVTSVISGDDVRIESLSHTYPGANTPAVSAVDLTLAAGTTTVFAGRSGSGKSTIAQLVAGVFTPSQGRVLIGGVPADQAVSDGRRAVLLVTQDTHVFRGSLADNLRLASDDATDADMWSALSAVGAEWAKELDGGLDSELGRSLDNAQIQQIALARVLLADPRVVVLDEATAHGGPDGTLDRALEAVVRGRTAVIVAHRFAHAAMADHIVVMRHGRVAEYGSHAELVDVPGGAYAELWQAAGTSQPQEFRR